MDIYIACQSKTDTCEGKLIPRVLRRYYLDSGRFIALLDSRFKYLTVITMSSLLPPAPLGPLQALDSSNQSPLFRRRANTREREHLLQIQAQQAANASHGMEDKEGSQFVARQPKDPNQANNNVAGSLNLNL